MWNLLEDGFTREKFGEDIEHLVDFPHLVSKLSAAAKVVADAGTEEETMNRWKLRLLNRDGGIIEILEECPPRLWPAFSTMAPVSGREPGAADSSGLPRPFQVLWHGDLGPARVVIRSTR